MADLKSILPDKLKQDITPAEEKLLTCSETGVLADFSTGDADADNPENAGNWGPERTIRPAFLYWLCTDKQATELVHVKGVQIEGAKVGGNLDFDSANIHRPLKMVGCVIKDIMMLDTEARLLAFLGCTTGAITADRLFTKGNFILRGTRVSGEVSLLGANIGGDLDCTGAEFENRGGYAFSADGVRIKGGAILAATKAAGEVRLPGADVGVDLDCTGAEFSNPNGDALVADGLKIKRDVFLREGFKAAGVVRLPGAEINGQLDCAGAEFNNLAGDAFIADGLRAKGGVLLRKGFKAAGVVRLINADISGNLEFTGAELNNPGGYALICQNARVTGGLVLRNMKPIVGRLDLTHMRADALVEDRSGWPEKGELYVEGFEYNGLTGGTTPNTAKERLEWLRLQPTEIEGNRVFFPRPYEQLAKVFRQMGHESDARRVLIAKQEDLRKYGKLSLKDKVWNRVKGITLGHGYQPWRAILVLLFMLLAGWGTFGWADNMGIMQPSKERVYMDSSYKDLHMLPLQYPRFSPFIYSLDVLVPVLDLHQESYWLPDSTKPKGCLVRGYFWAHIIVGWVFSTLALFSLTGLVRKE